jgi:hypothetical protein
MRIDSLLLGSIALVLLSGCVTYADYPSEWPKLSESTINQCPMVEGRYADIGVVSGRHPCIAQVRQDGSYYYRWYCDRRLSSNVLMEKISDSNQSESIRWVELKQPDNDTLVVQHDLMKTPVVLKRKDGDFACTREGLSISRSGPGYRREGESTLATGALVTFGVFVGSGNIEMLTRSFRRLQDGSLVMEVTNSAVGVHLFIPFFFGDREYVRWMTFSH